MAHIICLGSQRWRKLPTRTQWLLTQLNHYHQILYFQPSPVLFSRDPHSKEYKKEGWNPQPNITVYTLPPIFHLTDYQHPRLLSHNERTMSKYIHEKVRSHRLYNVLLWVCSPQYATLLDDLEFQGLVYDCFQDWSEYDIRWESILANRADVLFAASPGLVEHLAPCNTNIILLPNGGDYELFRRTEDLTLQVPPRLFRIRGPLLGYLGDVGRNVDLRPVYRTAKSHPGWSFVFVGRCGKGNPLCQTLSKLPNVHFLGKVNPSEYPNYAVQFDVLFDLLETADPDEDVIPSRIYEYLMVGKPIAAMYPARYIPVYSDVIYGARSIKEFMEACEQAVLENSSWAPSKRRSYGVEADWSVRAKEAERILENNSLL